MGYFTKTALNLPLRLFVPAFFPHLLKPISSYICYLTFVCYYSWGDVLPGYNLMFVEISRLKSTRLIRRSCKVLSGNRRWERYPYHCKKSSRGLIQGKERVFAVTLKKRALNLIYFLHVDMMRWRKQQKKKRSLLSNSTSRRQAIFFFFKSPKLGNYDSDSKKFNLSILEFT